MELRSQSVLQDISKQRTLDWAKVKILRQMLEQTFQYSHGWKIPVEQTTIALWMDAEGVGQIACGNRMDGRKEETEATIQQWEEEEPEIAELFTELMTIIGGLNKFWKTEKENIQFLCYANKKFEIVAICRPITGFPFEQWISLAAAEPKLEDWSQKFHAEFTTNWENLEGQYKS